MCVVTKAPPINSIDSKCFTKKLKNSKTHLSGYSGFISRKWLICNSPGADTHIRTDFQDKSTCLIKYKQLTQHTIALSLKWINPLCQCLPSTVLNNTQTTWCFLVKVPYPGKLSVIYDAENKGLCHFLVMKIKG